uniref:angiomotin-like protein 1 n=1 Tax=Myxine glutinosa TaxID=7769 RepID=UPI00358DDD10
MKSSNEGAGGVLQRLLQEKLRIAGPAEQRSLLTLQHQAAGAVVQGVTGVASQTSTVPSTTIQPVLASEPSVSSNESLAYESRQVARQEPQGQEHQGGESLEKQSQWGAAAPTPALLQEELPSYEEAKAHSQLYGGFSTASLQVQPGKAMGTMGTQGQATFYLAGTLGSHKGRTEGRASLQRNSPLPIVQDDGLKDLKQGHVRSLSERLMQKTLQNSGAKTSQPQPDSVPEVYGASFRGPPPDYPFIWGPNGPTTSLQSIWSSPPLPPTPATAEIVRYQAPPEYSATRQATSTVSAAAATAPHLQFHSPSGSQGSVSSLSGMTVLSPAGLPPVCPYGSLGFTGAFGMHGPEALARVQHTANILAENNRVLRSELDVVSEKATRVQKLEQEMQRIVEHYDSLVMSTSKRENLEKAMQMKLESEIRRLHESNRDLRDRLETKSKQLSSRENDGAEENRLVIAKLVTQNKENLVAKEKMDVEVSAMRTTNSDQRRHIELLNQALNTAQAKNVKLEEELRKKQFYVEKVEKLQQALSHLQAACEKREQLERRLRTRLERELETLRAQQRKGSSSPSGINEQNASGLMELLREKEERILALEADMTRWEQKYLEENAMRYFAMDAAATAATQRDTTLITHSPHGSFSESSLEVCMPEEEDGLLLSNRRCHEMESRIKTLHAQIIEKDAMIKVLQQRSRKEHKAESSPASSGLRPAKSVPAISPMSLMPPGTAPLHRKAIIAALPQSPLPEEQLSLRTGSLSGLTTANSTEDAKASLPPTGPLARLASPPLLHRTASPSQMYRIVSSLQPSLHSKSSSKDSSTQTEASRNAAIADADRRKCNTLPRGSKCMSGFSSLYTSESHERLDLKSVNEKIVHECRSLLSLSLTGAALAEDTSDGETVEILI